MTAVQFPGLSGVLPDHGRFDPLDWGLGVSSTPEPRDVDGHEAPPQRHSGTSAAPGRSCGWIPEVKVACAALTDREFDEWAKEAWPKLSDAVLRIDGCDGGLA